METMHDGIMTPQILGFTTSNFPVELNVTITFVLAFGHYQEKNLLNLKYIRYVVQTHFKVTLENSQYIM